MVEGAALEKQCAGNGTESSNLSPSAIDRWPQIRYSMSTMTNTERVSDFSPTEIWTPRSDDLDQYIELARYELNRKNPKKLIHNLKHKVERWDNGVVYAILDGDKPNQYSKTDALVLFNPHANTATANMLIRTEFIRTAARLADVRDDQGKLKPVIMLAMPGLVRGSSLHLTRQERKLIKNGQLGPAAKEYLNTVSYLGFGRVALRGASEGADMALSAGRHAYSSNLDVESLAAGDVVGVENRRLPKLALDFLSSGESFQASVEASDIRAQRKAVGAKPYSLARNIDLAQFAISIPYRTNWNLLNGISQDSFADQMRGLLVEGKIDKIAVAYGGEEDTITKPKAIEPSMNDLYHEYGPDSFTSIKIQGVGHGWGDELPLLAKFYMLGLV